MMSTESTAITDGPDDAVAADPAQEASVPVFRGTPEDWWEAAEEITESHAAERTFGDWYITKLRITGSATPAFRIATPSKPPSEARRIAYINSRPTDEIATNVRRLIRTETPVAAWLTSDFVMADMDEGSADRCPWIRKNNGRWQRLTDGRITVNDHTMSELNPHPATIS
jgi:hypothetical protein